MTKTQRFTLLLLILLVSLACGKSATSLPTPPPSPTSAPASTWTPVPSLTPVPPPTRRPTITIEPTNTAFVVTGQPPSNPALAQNMQRQKVTIKTSDGIDLVGYFYPAAVANSPLVVMMHQFGSNQVSAWTESEIIPWLQSPSTGSPDDPIYAEGKLPRKPAGVSFNVLTFDFRGHGESGGAPIPFITEQAQKEYLLDAQAAYAFARTLANIDPNKILGFGTSIGADAVVDTCGDGCVGAFAISPGNWLGLDWYTMAAQVINQGKQIRCMYSTNDGITAGTCTALANSEHYRSHGYTGKKHGQDFLVPRKMEDTFGKNLLKFLLLATGQFIPEYLK